MALDDTRKLTVVDPSHLTERERRKTALGCGGLGIITAVLTTISWSINVAFDPSFLIVLGPLSLIGGAAIYAVNRPRRLTLTRRGRTVRLLLDDVDMTTGGQLTLVATTKHLGKGRHAPALELFYTGREMTRLVEATTDLEAMQAVTEEVAAFMSATVHPIVLPAGTRPPERLTAAYDTGPKRGECPRCAVALDRIGGPLDEHRCATCGGRLLGTIGAERLVEEELGIDRAMLYDLRHEFGGRGAHCPLCTSLMDATQMKGERVDLCGGCGALWLDAGELSRLSHNRYSERDDPEI